MISVFYFGFLSSLIIFCFFKIKCYLYCNIVIVIIIS